MNDVAVILIWKRIAFPSCVFLPVDGSVAWQLKRPRNVIAAFHETNRWVMIENKKWFKKNCDRLGWQRICLLNLFAELNWTEFNFYKVCKEFKERQEKLKRKEIYSSRKFGRMMVFDIVGDLKTESVGNRMVPNSDRLGISTSELYWERILYVL